MKKIKFSASGSNSMVISMCKDSICRNLESWANRHSTGITIEKHSATVICEFANEEAFTLFLLTWEQPRLPHYRYTVVN